MPQTDDIDKLNAELADELQQIQAKKERLNLLQQEALLAEQQRKETELQQVVSDAKAFRIEASHAQTDSERQTLRGYAKECEERAGVLRVELGLSQPEPDAEPEPRENGHLVWLNRQIWGNLRLSLCFLAAWFGLYYVGEGTTGTIGYIAQVLSKPAFHAFLLFAGLLFVFLVVRRYFYNVTEYLNQWQPGISFAVDFQECSPFVRLFFVLGLLYVITQFLAAIYQVTL